MQLNNFCQFVLVFVAALVAALNVAAAAENTTSSTEMMMESAMTTSSSMMMNATTTMPMLTTKTQEGKTGAAGPVVTVTAVAWTGTTVDTTGNTTMPMHEGTSTMKSNMETTAMNGCEAVLPGVAFIVITQVFYYLYC